MVEVTAETTPSDVLAALELTDRRGTFLTLVNGKSVPANEHSSFRLEENDTLTVYPPIKGG